MIMVNLHFVRDVVPVSDSNENSGVEHNKVSSGLNINQVAYSCDLQWTMVVRDYVW